MNITSQTEQPREIVKRFYDGGARGEITSFSDSLAEDFEYAGVMAYPTSTSPITGAMFIQPCVLGSRAWASTYNNISIAKEAPIYGRLPTV